MNMQELFEANHWGNGRQAKFLDLYNAWEAVNQIEEKGIIVDIEKEENDVVYLDMLWVPQEIRYKGWGKKIMNALCDFADKTGITLRCEPLWQDDEDDSEFPLTSFYKAFGFEYYERYYKNGAGAFLRKPQVLEARTTSHWII